MTSSRPVVAVVGGGPAGLMAAEVLSLHGMQVDVYDAMPSVGRKFLRAGIGGLNITHSEAYDAFCGRYGDRQPQLQAMLDRFPPSALRAWVHGLGIDTFVGSSGRVFPTQMKAAPLLRAWLHRLRSAGVRLHVRHRWLGWNADGTLRLAHPGGEISIKPQATVLALGGASWPQLGADGAWLPWLQARGVKIAPLQSANCGFEVAWSAHLRDKFAGAQLKSVSLTFTDAYGRTEQRQGEMVIGAHGVEGSLIYAFSQRLREHLNAHGSATFTLDLAPGRDAARVLADVSHPRGSRSISSHLQSRVSISGVKLALLHEALNKEQFADAATLAATIKSLPITVRATRPVAEAISTAGGVRFDSLDQNLMITALPGVFVAGEMLDWEAPTGGYLLNACFATGLCAGQGVRDWLGTAANAGMD
ncbi:TIGR03862 family flavoprotein [Noviherbaspirillum sedimenti]|uniref:TIGR03862 family flavoprotein n=1 Tax=Noviherbaspirillum sedimenti TaxID=2320865 RepID=A0A3A3GC06_9BURK|nr:TIGR03862 family flavoprotein [Noviherbaspirillum sedimenti]RJG04339.1 TIGR03862 family flavoprotein [Noviherbaspirillum sedimenti]